MRRAFGFPLFCVVSLLAAGGPFDDFLQRKKATDPRVALWLLCVRSGDLTQQDLLADPVFQRLIVGGDLMLQPLAPGEARDLWAQQAWDPQPHWALVSPAADLVVSGKGRPTGDQVLAAIHNAGGRTRAELRGEFLKEHPLQGEARREALNEAVRLTRTRLMALDRAGKMKVPAWHPEAGGGLLGAGSRISLAATPEGEAQADELYVDWAEALEKLVAVPGWEVDSRVVSSHLMFWDVGQSTRMRRIFAGLAAAAEDRMRSDPYDLDAANFWVEAADAGRLPAANLAGLCLPVPGRSWPPSLLVGRFLEPFRRRKDPQGALNLLADLTPQAPPEPLSAAAWDDHCRLHSALLAHRAMALAGLGSWDLAASALEQASAWGGGQGVREALIMRGGQWTSAPADQNAWRLLITQALLRPGAKPPMPAAQPALRLVVLGLPNWILAWSTLSQAPELAPWSPAELRWEVASREVQAKLRETYGFGPGPRWALFRGEDLRAQGEACPTARGLAATLEAQGSSLLQRLNQVIAAQPDHLAARRERFALLLKRMPDPRLEATLAEDAAEARIALDFDPTAPWKPDPDTWAGAAQRVLPKVEAELRCWPERVALWNTWMAWARFHPARPGVVALAQSLPYWSPREDWRAELPYSVQRAVAAELRRQGNFNVMRDWFRAAWDALDHRSAHSLRRGEREWLLERRKEEETAVFQPLRDALRALGCTQEQAELERVFGEMMGKESRKT